MARRRSVVTASTAASRRPSRGQVPVAAIGAALTNASPRWAVVGVCCALLAAIWLVFGQVIDHGFLNFDDDIYVYDNPVVVRGLTLDGVLWAFTHVHAANWHPLT